MPRASSAGWQCATSWTARVLPLIAALAFSVPARAQAAVEVNVDASAAGAPLERVWSFHGYDEINYTTTLEGAALLRDLAAAHAARVFVRSHFLFNTGDGAPARKWGSTNVYTEDAAGNPLFDWRLTDGIFDTFSAAGVVPFVELGFMPQALSAAPVPYGNSSVRALDGGCFAPPRDYDRWAALIREWAAHANARYPNVANSWLWELWNEPDIGYWHGSLAEYSKLFDYTEAALHEVLPNAVLGGPAVASVQTGFLQPFLEHAATGRNEVSGKTGVRLDLISFHAKGGVVMADEHVRMNLGSQLQLHQAGFSQVAAFNQFQQTPIYITEADPEGCAACTVSDNPANAYRNSTAYGAYEVAMMKRSLELAARTGVKLGGVLTWAFTFPETPYFAGYRVLATNGIHLPVLAAFELLGRLSGSRLPLTSSGARPLDDILINSVRGEADIDGMATLDGDAVQVLVWNYHDDLVPSDATPVTLKVKLPPGFGARVRVTHHRVDETHGDAHTVWVAQGMPQTPSEQQLAALRDAMTPAAIEVDGVLSVAGDGTASLSFELPRFGVSLLSLRPEVSSSPKQEPRGGCACHFAARRGVMAEFAAPLAALGALLSLRRRRRACRGRSLE